MNFVFISPHFPHTYWNFCQRLKQNGEALLDYAKSHGVKRIFLEGNTRLEASIALYCKLGFGEIPLEGNAYERCDILMEIKL